MILVSQWWSQIRERMEVCDVQTEVMRRWMSHLVMDTVGEAGAFSCAGSGICYSTLKPGSWRVGILPNLVSKIDVGIVTHCEFALIACVK